MIEYVVWLVLYAVAVERATELIHKSKIFLPLRTWLQLTAYPDVIDPTALPDVVRHPAPPLEPYVWRESPFEQHLGRRLALFVSTMLDCGYCASVWVAAAFALWFPSYNNTNISQVYPVGSTISQVDLRVYTTGCVGWLLKLLVLHGLANLYHVVYERARTGRVRTYDISLTSHSTVPGSPQSDS